MNASKRLRLAAFATMSGAVALSTQSVSAEVTCHEPFYYVTFTHDAPWYEGACQDPGMDEMGQLACQVCNYGNLSMILECKETPVGELFIACTGS